MTSAHWHLAFSADAVSEPVLWELARRGVHVNIRRANVEEDVAWVLVEVSGPDLDGAREWLGSRGVVVSDL